MTLDTGHKYPALLALEWPGVFASVFPRRHPPLNSYGSQLAGGGDACWANGGPGAGQPSWWGIMVGPMICCASLCFSLTTAGQRIRSFCRCLTDDSLPNPDCCRSAGWVIRPGVYSSWAFTRFVAGTPGATEAASALPMGLMSGG